LLYFVHEGKMPLIKGFMKRLLLIIGLLIPLYGSSVTRIDSLLSALSTASNDSVRVDIYARLSQEYSDLDNFKLATQQLHMALDLMENEVGSRKYIWHLLSLSNAYLMQQNPQPAMEYAKKAAIMANATGLSDAEARAYLNIGAVLIDSQKYDEAEKNILKALSLSLSKKDSLFISYAYNNLAMVYRHEKKYDQALNYLFKALAIKKKIGAPGGTISTLGNIARVYNDQKLYDSALKQNQAALDVSKKLGSAFYMAHTYRNIGSLYTDMGLYKLAITSTEKALELAVKNGFTIIQRDTYENLSKIMLLQGNYKGAFKYQQKFMTLSDSLTELKTQNRIAEMEKLYNNEKKVRQIESLQLQNERMLRNFHITVTLFLLLILAIIYFRNSKIRKTKKALKESEKKFRLLAENASEVVWASDLELKPDYVSPAIEKLDGYSREEHLNQPLTRFITSKTSADLTAGIEKLKQEFLNHGKIEEPLLIETSGIHKNGELIWVESTVTLVVDDNGKLIGLQGISRNISDRKNAELRLVELVRDLGLQDKKLKAQNEELDAARLAIEKTADQYFDLFENGPVGYLIVDKDGIITEINSTASILLDAPKSELINKAFPGFVNPESRKDLLAKIEQTIRISSTHSAEFSIENPKDLLRVKLFFVPERSSHQGVVRIAIIDVTKEHKIRTELGAALQLMESVFDTIPGGISVVDKEYNIINFNNRLMEINGISDRSGAIGKKCYEVFRCGTEPCKDCSLTEILKTQKTVIKNTTYEDEIRVGTPLRIYSNPMINELGQVIGMVEAVMDMSDLKKAELALQESEKKFEQLFNEIPDAIFITRYGGTNSGEIVNVNPSAEQQTGYSKSELLQMNIVKDLSYEKQTEPLRLEREDQLLKDKKIEFIERKRRKNGSLIWTEVGIQKIRLHNEDLALSVCRDITDRKKTEMDLMISEAKNRSLINAIPDIIFVLNRDGVFVNYHSHSIDEFLVPPSVFLGKKASDVLPKDIAEVTMQKIAKVLNTGETQVYDYRLFLNGGYSNYEARMAISNTDEVLVIVRNITERKTAEMEIRQREEKYRSIFTNSPVGIFTFNQHSEIIDSNENFIDIIGSSRENLLGLNLLKNLKDNKLKNALEEALNKGSSYYEDNLLSVTDNKETPVKIFLKTINDADGKFIEGVGICEDITGQKIYEKEIINAREKAEQSDKMKSAFMATMSHELRTPLNAVIGFSEMIDTGLPMDQIEEFSQIISKSGRHLLTIIEDIFDITSIESGEIKAHIEKVTINDTMKDMYQVCLNEKSRVGKDHLNVILNIPADLEDLKISTDVPKFHKLIFHLLNNAIKFTKEGTIEFGFTTETKSHNPRNLLFFVKDTGIGIPKEKQQVIFEIFRQADETSTREFEGTGLGLSISKKLIELLGGNIWLESTVGAGSQFFFELPCLDTTFNIMDFLKQQNLQEATQGTNLVAMVAEDDDTNYQLFDLLLRRKKFRIIRASNGEEAVNKFIENPDINLVLMDINMPIMNGYEATRALKKIRSEVPVIAVTAYALSGDDLKAAEAGCNDYLSKPINNKLFYETIFKHI